MSKIVDVDLLIPSSEDEYTEFILKTLGATFYHSLTFRDLLIEVLNPIVEYALARRDGLIVGVLPLMGRAGPCGTVFNSLPFFGSYGGILAVDADARECLANWFLNRLGSKDVAAATVVSNPFDPNQNQEWEDADASDLRVAQWTPLPSAARCNTTLFGLIDGSARRNVRTAEKAGVTVSIDNSAFAFLEMTHRANMAVIGGNHKPATFFTAVQRVMRADEDYRLYVAHHQNVPVAAILLFYHGDYVEYITPVTAMDSRDLQPTAAILYKAMTDAIHEGRRVWNWGGTWLEQDGVYRFKRKWGAKERQYKYSTFVREPSLVRMIPTEVSKHYPYFYVFPFKRGPLTAEATQPKNIISS